MVQHTIQVHIKKGSGYWYACGSWYLKTYSYATCEVTVMHDESAVGLSKGQWRQYHQRRDVPPVLV